MSDRPESSETPTPAKRPLIDREYTCQLRDGSEVRVNVFDLNLAVACGTDPYVQLADGSWIRPSYLTIGAAA